MAPHSLKTATIVLAAVLCMLVLGTVVAWLAWERKMQTLCPWEDPLPHWVGPPAWRCGVQRVWHVLPGCAAPPVLPPGWQVHTWTQEEVKALCVSTVGKPVPLSPELARTLVLLKHGGVCCLPSTKTYDPAAVAQWVQNYQLVLTEDGDLAASAWNHPALHAHLAQAVRLGHAERTLWACVTDDAYYTRYHAEQAIRLIA
jgi:hypothetical protein